MIGWVWGRSRKVLKGDAWVFSSTWVDGQHWQGGKGVASVWDRLSPRNLRAGGNARKQLDKGLDLYREVWAGQMVDAAQVEVLVKVIGQAGSSRALRNSQRQERSYWLVVCICAELAKGPWIATWAPVSQGLRGNGSG